MSSPSTQTAAPRPESTAALTTTGKFRWVIVALLFSATIINYMDRQILGLLKPYLAKDLNWTEQDYANIVIAFQAAYAIGQVFFGPIIEWIGLKSAYAASIVFWSFAAMAHALARSVMGFSIARFALGIGESGNFPAAIKTVAEWFPPKERALATGIFNSGSNVGAIIAPVIVPWIALQYSWQAAFIVLGASGFLWLAAWWVYYDAPEKSKRLSASERAYITETAVGATAVVEKKLPWSKILGYRQTWAYVATGLFVGPVWWFYLFWLPDIFAKQFKLDMKSFGLPLVVVYSVTCFGSIFYGWLSSFLIKKGWSINAARKGTLLICAVSPIPVAFVGSMTNVWLATACFAFAAAAHQGWSANMYTAVSDIFPKRAVASVVGLAGTLAAVASMAFAYVVGKVLSGSGVYDNILMVCGFAYIAALTIFHLVVPRLDKIEIKD